jgi:hypothetical protein
MTRLLLICHDVVDAKMAGPGVRYWEMARALSKKLDVTLATPGRGLAAKGLASHVYDLDDWETLIPAVSVADVLLLPGLLVRQFPQLMTCGKPLIMEATYPYTFEPLQINAHLPREQQWLNFPANLELTRLVALSGDFFFCASQRQRDYWLGVLDTLGRINPDTYTLDPALYGLIDVVPFGLPSRQPEYATPVMKGVIPGIGSTDRVILWGGGLWQWLDPLTLVRAVARVAQEHPDVRLVFPATRHPNPQVLDMPMLHHTIKLSDDLGLTDSIVFFGDWVPYHLWPNYLLEADIGASLHFDTLETRFAFRTRMLDYIWAGLPMVVTGGDETSQLVTGYGLGCVVNPGDERAVVAAILRLLAMPDLREAHRKEFEKVRPHFTWERICEPIERFCQQPRLAADRAAGRVPFRTAAERALLAQVGRLQEQGEQQRSELTQLLQRCGQHRAESERLQALVHAYEQGRFMRLMRTLHTWRHKLRL